MVGVARIVVGAILFVVGLPFLVIYLVGLIPMAIGAALIASGLKARDRKRIQAALGTDPQRTLQQQIETNIRIMQAQAASASSVGQRQCPSCGAVNAGPDAYCRQCGRPLSAAV